VTAVALVLVPGWVVVKTYHHYHCFQGLVSLSSTLHAVSLCMSNFSGGHLAHGPNPGSIIFDEQVTSSGPAWLLMHGSNTHLTRTQVCNKKNKQGK